MIDDRTASGIEIAMITVERQLPRNSRIIRLVSAAAIMPSRNHAGDRRLARKRLVRERRDMLSDDGRVSFSFGSSALTPATMASVEADPLLSTVISTERRPSMRTMLVCGG